MGIFKNKQVTTEKAPQRPGSKCIVFFGLENGLIPYHTAKTLLAKNSENRILLIDNSDEQELFESIPHTGEIGDAGGIYVLSRREYNEEVFVCFDYVIISLGIHADTTYLKQADILFLETDYTPNSVKRITDLSSSYTSKEMIVHMIFLNKASSKIKEKDVMHQIPFLTKESMYVISEVSMEDTQGRISFLYNGAHPLTAMSADWKEMIGEISGICQGTSIDNYKKLVKLIS